jgi:hypothetical protein
LNNDQHGQKTKTDGETLDKVLTMYHKLRGNDRIVTLNMIAAEIWRMDSGFKGLSLSTIHCQIYRHLRKYGGVHRHVTHVAQNTRYNEGVKAGCVDFVKASDIINIGETYVEFDLFG